MPLCGVFGLGDLRDDRHVDGGSGEREVGELSAELIVDRDCVSCGGTPAGSAPGRRGIAARRRIRYGVGVCEARQGGGALRYRFACLPNNNNNVGELLIRKPLVYTTV